MTSVTKINEEKNTVEIINPIDEPGSYMCDKCNRHVSEDSLYSNYPGQVWGTCKLCKNLLKRDLVKLYVEERDARIYDIQTIIMSHTKSLKKMAVLTKMMEAMRDEVGRDYDRVEAENVRLKEELQKFKTLTKKERKALRTRVKKDEGEPPPYHNFD